MELDLVHHKIGQVYHFRVFFRDGDGIRSIGKIIFYGKLQADGLVVKMNIPERDRKELNWNQKLLFIQKKRHTI